MSFTYKFLTSRNDNADLQSGTLHWVYGGAGNDTIRTDDTTADTIDGGSGSDHLVGDARDLLFGGSGDDTIYGGNIVRGGTGNDTYYLDQKSGSAPLAQRLIEDANAGYDFVELYVYESWTIVMPENLEALDVKVSNLATDPFAAFHITGTTQHNRIIGADGDDTIYGLSGNDDLFGDGGNDVLYGGLGNDFIVGGNRYDRMIGDYGNDTMNGIAQEDALFGDTMEGGGNDDVYEIGVNDVVIEAAFSGWDRVDAYINGYTMTAHVEELRYMQGGAASFVGNASGNLIHAAFANIGKLTVSGGDGNDTVRGGNAGDLLKGDAGNDQLEGNEGHDSLFGDAGHDRLFGGNGNDSLSGLADNDTMEGGAGNDMLDGGAGHDRLEGGANDDSLRGATGSDTILGNDGEDAISGDSGNDSLIGGAGNDLIVGGAGRDTMVGEAGFDFFIFQSTAHSMSIAADRINAFDVAEDVIDLAAIDADGGYGSFNKFTYIGDAPIAGIKGALWITAGPGVYSVFGDVNGDGLAEMRIDVWTSAGSSLGVENILL